MHTKSIATLFNYSSVEIPQKLQPQHQAHHKPHHRRIHRRTRGRKQRHYDVQSDAERIKRKKILKFNTKNLHTSKNVPYFATKIGT